MYQPNGMPSWWQPQVAPGQMPGQAGMGRQAPTQQPMPTPQPGEGRASREMDFYGMRGPSQAPPQRGAHQGVPSPMARPAVMPSYEQMPMSSMFDPSTGASSRDFRSRPAVMPNPYQGGMGQSPMGRYAAMNAQFYAGGGRGGMPGGGYQPPPMGFFGMPGQQKPGGVRSPYYQESNPRDFERGMTGAYFGPGHPYWQPPMQDVATGTRPITQDYGSGGMLQNPNWRSPQPSAMIGPESMGRYSPPSQQQAAPDGGRAQLLAMYQQMMGMR